MKKTRKQNSHRIWGGFCLWVFFFSPIRNATHPVPGQSRTFVYVYVFLLSLILDQCKLSFHTGKEDNAGRYKGGFQKGGFGGCSPGTKTGTRVRSDVPPERKPERGYVRQSHPFTKLPCYLPVKDISKSAMSKKNYRP